MRLVIVPKLGDRIMQVLFDGHSYLFANPKYKRQYFPPLPPNETGRWVNYGGDKRWPLPEGSEDDHHWPGPLSDVLDDGEYNFNALSEGTRCGILLEGPAGLRTGLQYSRDITLASESSEIKFHAVMENSSQRHFQWSMQTVTQYDTSDIHKPEGYNHEFWDFAPANPHSSYLQGYHVRAGLADAPSHSVSNGWFRLHWLPLMNDVGLDSPEGWIVVVDAASRYAMLECFTFHPGAEYPGLASVIFYKNGSTLELHREGQPLLSASHSDVPPLYMEAELNSPMISFRHGRTYAMDTTWYPARAGKELSELTISGLTGAPLAARRTLKGNRLTGIIGVFSQGTLKAHRYDRRKILLATVAIANVDPRESVRLENEIPAQPAAEGVTLHLFALHGVERGKLAAARVQPPSGGSRDPLWSP